MRETCEVTYILGRVYDTHLRQEERIGSKDRDGRKRAGTVNERGPRAIHSITPSCDLESLMGPTRSLVNHDQPAQHGLKNVNNSFAINGMEAELQQD